TPIEMKWSQFYLELLVDRGRDYFGKRELGAVFRGKIAASFQLGVDDRPLGREPRPVDSNNDRLCRHRGNPGENTVTGKAPLLFGGRRCRLGGGRKRRLE